MRKVKIVCTMGPSTAGVNRLVQLMHAGMDVARLNFSHGDYEAHKKMYNDIREAAKKVGKPVAILADLCGPKIRVGNMKGGSVVLEKNAKIIFTTKEIEGTSEKISHSYLPLARDVKPGDRILMDDGLLEVVVDSIKNDDEVVCRVVTSGILKDHKGMNLPGSKLSTPALTEKDKKDIIFGRELGVDYFALSFVRTPQDVKEARELAGDIPVIAKIEKPEAIEHLDEILDIANGAMVARGDLGVEAGQEKVPLIQKRIINEIKLRAKPVITATQMLDSMIHNPRPTRAEVSDVANAVLDGTDAVMLSAETSVGEYAVEAVETLASIIKEIEKSSYYEIQNHHHPQVKEHSFTNAISQAVVQASTYLDLKAIGVYSETGYTAAFVSAHRPKANIVCFSRHDKILNRAALYWGIIPLHADWVVGVDAVVEQAERELLCHNLVKSGDEIVLTFAVSIGGESFQTNTMKLWKIRK